jgi:hypothetical protein
MDVEGFEFTVDVLDECRLIQTVFPVSIDFRTVSVPSATFLSLWDDTTPTVLLADISRLLAIAPETRVLLKHILQRDEVRPNLIASSWVVGENDAMRLMLEELLPEVGRSIDTIFTTRYKAIDYLTSLIRSRK